MASAVGVAVAAMVVMLMRVMPGHPELTLDGDAGRLVWV